MTQSQLKLKTLILDNSILELIYNINIDMFENEISNETLEDAVLLKKNLNKNIYNYEIFKFRIKKIHRSWNKILTDNFKNLIIDFNKAYKKYYTEKIEYEKYLNRFSTKCDEKNLFKFMDGLSLKPKKTITKKN
jgi:hypothetical protein